MVRPLLFCGLSPIVFLSSVIRTNQKQNRIGGLLYCDYNTEKINLLIGRSGKALPTFGCAKNHKSIESDPNTAYLRSFLIKNNMIQNIK